MKSTTPTSNDGSNMKHSLHTFLAIWLPIIIAVVVFTLMSIYVYITRRRYAAKGIDIELANSPKHNNFNPVVVLMPIVPQHQLTPSQSSLVTPLPVHTGPTLGSQASKDRLKKRFDRFEVINEQARVASKSAFSGHKGAWVEKHEGKYIGARVNLKSKVDKRGSGIELKSLEKLSGSSGQSSENGDDESAPAVEPWTNIQI